MTVSTPFSSVSEADSAYYGSGDGDGDGGGGGGGGGGGDGSGGTWGKLQRKATLGSGWVLAYQDQQNGDRRRWFDIRMSGDTLQAIQPSGTVYDAKDSDKLSALPNYSSESDARAAFKKWAEKNGGGDQSGQGAESWGKWQKLTEQKPWHIYTRSHKTEDRQQFLAAGKLGDGGTVYLAPKGKVADEPHVYDSADALTKALRAYQQRVKNGEVPEDRRPTGDAPKTSTVRKEAKTVKTASQSKVERLVEKMGGQKVALAVVVVGGAVAYKSQQENAGGGS